MNGETLWRRAAPIYFALMLAVLTVFGILLLIELRHVLLILFISVLFASALSGPSARLERLRVPRAVSVPLLYLSALVLVGVALWLVIPPLFGQVAAFADEAPAYAERYDEIRDTYNELREDYPSLGSFDARVSRLGEGILDRAGERAVDLPSNLFELFLDLLSVFVISTLLVANRERLLAFVLSLVQPRHRERTATVLVAMWNRVGYYLRAKVIVMATVGVITYFALLAIGVPFAVLLALIVALGEAIPRVGPWLARIPLLAIAALEGVATLGITFAASIVIQNLKGYVISPVVEGKQLDLHPLFIFVAVLVGGALLGVAGAFIAVPAAAMVQVLVDEVVVPWRRGQLVEEPPLPPPAAPGPA